jgi:hypothetical protein
LHAFGFAPRLTIAGVGSGARDVASRVMFTGSQPEEGSWMMSSAMKKDVLVEWFNMSSKLRF